MSKTTTNIYHGSTLNFVWFEKLSSERGLIFEEIGQLLICLTIKEQTPFSNFFQAFDFIRSHVLSEKLSTYKTVLIAAYQQSVFKRGRPSSRSAFSTRRLRCDVWAMCNEKFYQIALQHLTAIISSSWSSFPPNTVKA
ncbi:hypothetical protein GQX74_013177 [Glossina fuscipes]|nr:hypothetical protein GQX74_013177 [Glossina fuscipes]